MTEMEPDAFLAHYGVLRKSGRYPWGSGEEPHQRNKQFLDHVETLRRQGMSDTQIVEGLGLESTTQLRALRSIAKTDVRRQQMQTALKLQEKGMSNVAIGKQMDLNESSVRALLDPAAQERNDVLAGTADMLKDRLAETNGGYLDIGAGVERHLQLSSTKLSTAVAMLEEEGYAVHTVQVEQQGTGKKTFVKVLAPEGTTYRDIVTNMDKIETLARYSENAGRDFEPIKPPRPIKSDRVAVRYKEDGGADKDGVIEVRRGVDDVSLGASRYLQVRMAVDGTHYLKGMAVYSDDLPPGIDVIFNTNKSDTGNKLDAMKKVKDDPENPFGSTIRQRHYIDANGKRQLSSMNIVNEEGDWSRWSGNLSSQMLSKQSTHLAKEQLDLSLEIRKNELEEIMGLTNPVVKKKLLDSYADGADSAAVHLKAAGLPRTRTHVILPVPSLKDTEIYAPNYNDGETVVLIRHPHGGVFEIPELTVNNRNPAAKSVMGGALDAVGIHPRVAERLSGADFDGDTVLVIPNNSGKVKNKPPLQGLKDFDPQRMYKLPDDAPKMSPKAKQQQMGDISNLITDMTIRGAPDSEIARAVRHSMVVIDAEKHHLDYKRSAQDNGIKDLKTKYQGGPTAGSATLISRASSQQRVGVRKDRSAKNGGPVDPATGKRVYDYSGETYTVTKLNKRTGAITEKVVPRTQMSTKMFEAEDARSLLSANGGMPMERIYANHANELKALGNKARKASLETPPRPMSPSAKKVYAPEVQKLNAKLNVALMNAPLERQAQLIANTIVTAKRQADPNMDSDTLKKVKAQALDTGRARTGAKKTRIVIEPMEWEAIQNGAVSTNMLSKILDNADLDQVKELATPRLSTVMTGPTMARAKSMLALGYTQAEIAQHLGIPASTITSALVKERSA